MKSRAGTGNPRQKGICMDKKDIAEILILMREQAQSKLEKAKAERDSATYIERLASEVYTLNTVIEMLTDDSFAKEVARCYLED